MNADRGSRAEAAVLGALMLDASLLERQALRREHFATEGHRTIFDAIAGLVEADMQPDIVAVLERLQRTGGGDCRQLATAIAAESAGTSNFDAYAGIIREEAQRRRVHVLARQILSAEGSVAETVEVALQSLAGIGDEAASRDHWSDESTVRAFQTLTDGKELSVPIGYSLLDDTLGGFYPGDLVVVGARPAMGKTSFALNLLARGTYVGGLISGEQPEAQIGLRNLALLGPVSLHKMRTRKMDDDDWRRASRGVEMARDRRYLIHDAPAPRIEDVRAKARRWKHEHGLQVLFVDYLQKLRGGDDTGGDFRIHVGMMASELKAIAREYAITVVALAQVKREVDNRDVGTDGTGCCPHASDLAESGMIENEADQILTLCRPAVYEPGDERWKHLVYVTIAKNRHGPERRVPLFWRGDTLHFENAAMDEYAAFGGAA